MSINIYSFAAQKITKMEKSNKPLGMVIGPMMKEVFQVVRKRMGEQPESNLTIDQFGLLHAISQEKVDVIQKDMAEIMGKDKSAILRMIDVLKKKELVRRVVDKNDRRKNYILLSKKGEQALECHYRIASELSNELMEGLTQSEIDNFYRVVDHLKRKAELLKLNS